MTSEMIQNQMNFRSNTSFILLKSFHENYYA